MGFRTAKRGRPKASSLPDLIREGEQFSGPIKCDFCFRNFPRMKSLMAHRRIHTDEKPYQCTYPGCYKPFRQSGQLKTHERRHTGEKPYACPIPGCTQRFIHSQRRCSRHPGCDLKKDDLEQIYIPENLSEEELKWFEEYQENKGKPVKRKMITSSEPIKFFKSESSRCNSPPSSSFRISSDGSCSEISSDSNSSNQENILQHDEQFNLRFNHGEMRANALQHNDDQFNLLLNPGEMQVHALQYNNRQFNLLFNPDEMEAAEILCSFSQRARRMYHANIDEKKILKANTLNGKYNLKNSKDLKEVLDYITSADLSDIDELDSDDDSFIESDNQSPPKGTDVSSESSDSEASDSDYNTSFHLISKKDISWRRRPFETKDLEITNVTTDENLEQNCPFILFSKILD